jgi:hypothetical protein
MASRELFPVAAATAAFIDLPILMNIADTARALARVKERLLGRAL